MTEQLYSRVDVINSYPVAKDRVMFLFNFRSDSRRPCPVAIYKAFPKLRHFYFGRLYVLCAPIASTMVTDWQVVYVAALYSMQSRSMFGYGVKLLRRCEPAVNPRGLIKQTGHLRSGIAAALLDSRRTEQLKRRHNCMA